MSRSNFEWLFRKLPAMATAIGPDVRYLDVNDRFLECLGYTREEVVGHRPVEFVTPESAELIEKEFMPTLRRTGRLEMKPIDFVSNSGETVHCHTSAVVEHDPDGALTRTVAIYTLVADPAGVDWNYQLYCSTPAMLHTADAEDCTVTVTDRRLRKMGYTREEVVGRPIIDFFRLADLKRFASERLKQIISGGEFTNEARQAMTKSGETIDLVQSETSEDTSGRVHRMLVASKDVTEPNRVESALRSTLEENAHLREELELEWGYLREEADVAMNFGRIVGQSDALTHMLEQVEAVAQTPTDVLVTGEFGVGKELVARAIHARSPRADAPLVKVNCASIPKELFESEFFGQIKEAFTGAHRNRVERFQLAHGGTLFLDEVGEIPLELQGKLLRVLQEREFERVGDDITTTVDVRVIAATNRELKALVVEGKFRQDLFYRLSVSSIEVPPLRQRGDDVIQLAQHFLEITCKDFGREPLELTQAQAGAILSYSWPGNVRELKNVIERAVILSKGNTLRLDLSLPEGSPQKGLRARGDVSDTVLTEEEMKSLQRDNIIVALRQTNWRISGEQGAARLLGIRPTTLSDRMRALGIKKPD